MFLRLFFVVRMLFSYSIYTDAFSKKICNSYGFSSGTRFVLKSKMLLEPGKSVIYLFTMSVLIFAYLIRIFELPYVYLGDDIESNNLLSSYFNAIWLVIVTITTVGYGDISPNTQPGKIIAILAALWGSILISLIVVTIQSIF
jgi:voltage-gated potassium channel Kch